ncbi:DUF4097 domain-containing protein [Bacillus sp. RD4P76]|uniref:DUF4097 domain-containing protein n=1 Tax=Bacillus suaedaesalsae TaxID=2810349 RepID=A0ABS2DKL0_9BACI|nr:DUF4097 domain-containing protein [Bacillus suaedaesalsae]
MTEERKRILKMIEEGKLSAEQALPLLEALELDSQKSEQKEEMLVHELSTHVNWDEGTHQSKGKTYKTVKTSVLDFLDQAVKKIKDFDLDFNFGSSMSVSHIFQHSDVYLTDIDIDVANGSIQMIPWNERDVRVECEAKVYQAQTEEEARRSFLQDVLFSIEGGKLKYSVQKKKMKVDAKIFVPEAQYDTISVRLFNGRIDGEGLRVKEFKAKTANGKITANRFETHKFEVETANGHITVGQLKSKKVEAETINGTINISGSYEKGDIQSFNGNVICTVDTSLCETLLIKSTTGNVDIIVPRNRHIQGELKSNVGSFRCDLTHLVKKEEKAEIVQKYLKFEANALESDQPLFIDGDTKTGSILIKEVK